MGLRRRSWLPALWPSKLNWFGSGVCPMSPTSSDQGLVGVRVTQLPWWWSEVGVWLTLTMRFVGRFAGNFWENCLHFCARAAGRDTHFLFLWSLDSRLRSLDLLLSREPAHRGSSRRVSETWPGLRISHRQTTRRGPPGGRPNTCPHVQSNVKWDSVSFILKLPNTYEIWQLSSRAYCNNVSKLF